MTKRELKKGETIVSKDKAEFINESGWNVAFFEKSIKTKNNNEIVKEYISIYNYNDKYTKLIRPTGEQKSTNKLGDSFFIEDKKRFPKAYQVFIDLRNFLNKK